MKDFNNFLAWRTNTRDTIDFKKIYVDMVGDLIAGLMLGRIIYWYLPDKEELCVKKTGTIGQQNPITIYRAGDANEVGVKPWASFTPERSVAEAYTDNPGFGGALS